MLARHWRLSPARLLRHEEGQDLAEYALLVALIALLVIIGITGLGTVVGRQYNTIAERLAAVL